LAEASIETITTARRVHGSAVPYIRDRIDEVLVPPLVARVRTHAARFGRGLPLITRDEIEDELNVAFWEACPSEAYDDALRDVVSCGPSTSRRSAA